jgi:hypothetical protein
MSILHMDDFTIYGTDAGRVARLLDGMYVENVRTDLVADPDPTAGGKFCCQKFPGGLGGALRKVLPAAKTTVGVAMRVWYDGFPSDARFAMFSDVGNNFHLIFKPDASGNIVVYRFDGGFTIGTQIAITATPVLLAHSWQHLEIKVFFDAVAGTIEIRREGITVLNFAGRTTSSVGGVAPSCQNVLLYSGQDGATMYVKDWIIWDSSGAFNNNFMGSCQVLKIIPNADVALNWTPSSGATGFNLINETSPDDDANYIAAPFPAPAAYKCALSDLPATVTSVRGVMPVHRSRKTDGGDGNIQLGAVSGGSTGLGADRPITTAYTYYADIFDADPATAGAWSRVSVNALNLQINRTL